MVNVVPLHNETHKDLKVDLGDVRMAAEQHIIPIVAHEVTMIGSELPVVFIKNAETGQFIMAVITGFEAGENLMVENNRWQGDVVPEIVRNHPFKILQANESENQVALGIDMDSVTVGTEEGEALFTADGKMTDFMNQCKDNMVAHLERSQVTQSFVQDLVNKGLLVGQSLNVEVEGQAMTLDGMYFVDEAKLNGLSDEDFLEFKKRGFLPVIYAHLGSRYHMRQLLIKKGAQLKGRE